MFGITVVCAVGAFENGSAAVWGDAIAASAYERGLTAIGQVYYVAGNILYRDYEASLICEAGTGF